MRSLLAAPTCLLFVLSACSGGSGTGNACTDAAALEPGAATALVDGAAWASTGTWVWQGESLQLNTPTADGWFFTLVAQASTSGETPKSMADAGDFPIEIVLIDGASGGWAVAYPDAGDSYNTADTAGGTLSIGAIEADELFACFSFVAASEGGAEVTVEDGAVRALPF